MLLLLLYLCTCCTGVHTQHKNLGTEVGVVVVVVEPVLVCTHTAEEPGYRSLCCVILCFVVAIGVVVVGMVFI